MKISCYFLCIIFAAIFIYSDIFATEPKATIPAFSLNDIYKMTLSAQESIKIESEKVQEIKSQREQIVGSILPQFSASGTEYFQNGEANGSAGSRRPEYKLSYKQALFSGFRDQDALQAIDVALAKQQVLIFQAKREAKEQVMTLYFQGRLFQEKIADLAEARGILNDRIQELNRRVRLGRSRSNEILSADSDRLNLLAQETALKGQLLSVQTALSNLVGKTLGDFTFLDPPSQPVKILTPKERDAVVEKRPEILALKADIRYETLQNQLAQHSNYPAITSVANYYLRRADALNNVKWDWSATVSFPIYQSGVDAAQVRESDSRLRQLELRLAQSRRSIFANLTADAIAYQAALAEQEQTQQAYQKARQSYLAEAADYRLGLVNHLDVLQSLNKSTQLKQNLDTAIVKVKQAAYQVLWDQEI